MFSPTFAVVENEFAVNNQKTEVYVADSEAEDSGFNGSNSTDSSSTKTKCESLCLAASTSFEIIASNEEAVVDSTIESTGIKFPPIPVTSISSPIITISNQNHSGFHRTLSEPKLQTFNKSNAQLTDNITTERCRKKSQSAKITRTKFTDKNGYLINCSNSLPTLTEDRQISQNQALENINVFESQFRESSKSSKSDRLSSNTSSKSVTLPPIISKKYPQIVHSNSLPCLKINDARKRNFLVGNSESTGALLGAVELERHFPTGKLNLFVGTWNVHRKHISESLNDFLLPSQLAYIPDMYVIGIEEATLPHKNDWELKLQETIGLSHVLFHSTFLGSLHLSVFLRRELIWFCSVPEASNFKLNASINTKGAVATQFLLFGTSFLFLCSHFTAHVEKLKERIQDYKKIIANINLPQVNLVTARKHKKELFDRYDCVFWMGDLNFRLNQKREIIMSQINLIQQELNPNFDDILCNDQLKQCMSRGDVFKGFNEGRINFMPTYKYNPGTNDFDTSEKLRTPSYTDRILYRNLKKNTVSCIYYDSVQKLCSSDHKPVYAVFEVTLRPGRDNVPLAAAFYRRDIYLNAIRKRTDSFTDFSAKTRSSLTSSVCSIM